MVTKIVRRRRVQSTTACGLFIYQRDCTDGTVLPCKLFLVPADLTDLRGFEIEYGVQLPCGLFICQRDCTDYTVLQDPCDPRDPWIFSSSVSWGFTRMVLLRYS